MDVYAWHYFNLSMDNTNRCHIYLFSFREVQLFKKGFSHNEQTYNHNYHHQKIIQTLYNRITSTPLCVQKYFAVSTFTLLLSICASLVI